MAAKTLYFKNAVSSGAMSLQDGGTPPPAGITRTGWTVGKTVAGNFSLMAADSEASIFAPADALTPPSLSASSCWRSEQPFSGSFDNADWTLTFRLRAASAAASQAGRVCCRMWKASDVNGAGAVELTSSILIGSTTAALTQSTPDTSTVVWTPGGVVVFDNEYLFVQCEWEITQETANANSDVLFYIDSTSVVLTPNFAQGQSMTEPCCSDCRYWVPISADRGRCHRHAPGPVVQMPMQAPGAIDAVHHAPITTADFWCGDFASK